MATDITSVSPLIKVGGGGTYISWLLGALKALSELESSDSFVYAAASAGALASALTICGVDPEYAINHVWGKYNEAGVQNRFLGYALIWGDITRDCLEHLLPLNAAELCENRLFVHVTEWKGIRKGFSIQRVHYFSNRKVLIDTLMASAHIPWFMDGKKTAKLNRNNNLGQEQTYHAVDGSILHFVPFKSSLWGLKKEEIKLTSKVGRKADFTVSHTFDPALKNDGPLGFITTYDDQKNFELLNKGYEFTKKQISSSNFFKTL